MSDAEKWLLLTIHANETRRMHTKRTQDVIISRSGSELARKLVLYKRGKAIETSFLFAPAGLSILSEHHS